MSIRGCVVVAAFFAACSSRTVGERERALERIPAQAQVIFAADGTALATPTFRRVVDSLTPHVPPSLACVVEASTTSEAIVVGVQLDVGATIVLVTRSVVERCPALSKIGEHTYVATIGAGAVSDRASSIMVAPQWERARPYLVREPVAIAAELVPLRLIAVAQPEPLDAWLAVDSTDSVAIERAITAMLDTWRVPGTIELAGKLSVARHGTQVSVQADGLTDADLVTIIGDTLDALEAPVSAPDVASVFVCPPSAGSGVVSCHDGTHFVVASIEDVLRELSAVESAPVIAGGDIIGIRLLGEPRRVLRRDDVVLGINSHRITAAAQLVELAPHAGGSVAIAVRREGIEAVVELGQ